MILTSELRPEEFTALHSRADAESVDVETVLHRLVAQIAPPPVLEAQGKRELTRSRRASQPFCNPGVTRTRRTTPKNWPSATGTWKS